MRSAVIGVLVVLTAVAAGAGHAAADPFVVAVGDIACGPTDSAFGGRTDPALCQDRATSDLVGSSGATAVLTLGDQQYCCGTITQFNASYDRTWGRYKAITHPAPGNHEYQTTEAAGYFDYFNGGGNFTGPAGDRDKGYYSFDVGQWHIVSLNSNCGLIAPPANGCAAGSPQEQWLRADLASHPTGCSLAYWHHPRFSTNRSNTSMSVLWSDLYAAGADVVLSGHEHYYERFPPLDGSGVPDPALGVREFVVGTGGKDFTSFALPSGPSEVRQNDTFGILELALHPTSYDWLFVPQAGRTFGDSGTTPCHGTASGIRVPPNAPTALSVGASGMPASAPAGAAKCTIVGSPLDDVIVGTPGKDVICGLGGNDRIDGLGGDDVILGGPGDDRVAGGAGDDRIFGNLGNDSIDGGSGSDWVDGSHGRDQIVGGSGNDRVDAGAGNDTADGGSGDDRLSGGRGRDRLSGGSGSDLLDGGRGRDMLKGEAGDDRLSGGLGNDRLDGGSEADRLYAGRGRDVLLGKSGRDLLRTVDGHGRDSANGGSGRDRGSVDRGDRVTAIERLAVRP